jgi:hypothetical protein
MKIPCSIVFASHYARMLCSFEASHSDYVYPLGQYVFITIEPVHVHDRDQAQLARASVEIWRWAVIGL